MTVEHAVTGTTRHKKIGGSELAALCGLASYGTTPLDVYRRIVLGISGFTGSRYSDRGTREEPRVRAMYLATYRLKQAEHPGTMYMDDCFAGNLDDLIVDRTGAQYPVDYKTASNSASSLKKWGPSGSQLFPTQYKVQLCLYMAMGGWAFSQLFVAIGKDENDENGKDAGVFTVTDTRLYTIKRDMEFENQILTAGRQFWTNHIVPKIPPVDINSKPVLEIKLTPEELMSADVSPEDMDLFDLELPKSVEQQLTAPVAPPAVLAPPAPKFVIQQETPEEAEAAKKAYEAKIAAKSVPAPAPATTRLAENARQGEQYEVNGVGCSFLSMVGTAGGTDTFYSFRPLVGGVPVLVPAGTVIKMLASVLPPDAPKSDPVLAADPLPAGEEKPKRKRRTNVEITADEAAEATARLQAVKAEQDKLPSIPVPAAVPAPAVSFRLFIDCLPSGDKPITSLDSYVAKSVSDLTKACGVQDIRVSEDKALGFGKWKGTLANWVRSNPPAPGAYFLLTSGSEFAQVIGEALGYVAKGAR